MAVLIRLSAQDAGCLPTALNAVINQAETSIRLRGSVYTPEEKRWADEYLRQLRACLAAVVKARA